jgi:predicted CopG family antitoxin
MSKTLTITITDELYQALKNLADKEGKSAEDVGASWLAATVERISKDPLMALAGVLDSGIPDLAERHDDYIRRA